MTLKYITIGCIGILLASCANNKPVGQQVNVPKVTAKINGAQCNTHAFLKSYQCSIANIEQSAEAGDADAAYALGYIYYYGIGIGTDRQSAKLWIERAANLGQPSAIRAQQLLTQKIPTTKQHINRYPSPKRNPVPLMRHPVPLTRHPAIYTNAKQQNTTKHLTKNQGHYTIQISASHKRAPLEHMIKQYHLSHTKIIKTNDLGQHWFVLLKGQYHSRQQASTALNMYPKNIKALKPWIRTTDNLRA